MKTIPKILPRSLIRTNFADEIKCAAQLSIHCNDIPQTKGYDKECNGIHWKSIRFSGKKQKKKISEEIEIKWCDRECV